MTDDARPRRRDAPGHVRPRKPTPAERRAQRAEVEDPAQVLEAGARFLEARHRSVAEVRRKLVRLGYRADLVTDAIERLGELGYLDDDAFARAWVESRDRAKPRGEHALRRELGQKGVDRDARGHGPRRPARGRRRSPRPSWTSRRVSADEAAAERLLAKKLPAIRREADPRRRLQRAYALLARNGFGPDVCSSVSKRLLAEADLEDEAFDPE